MNCWVYPFQCILLYVRCVFFCDEGRVKHDWRPPITHTLAGGGHCWRRLSGICLAKRLVTCAIDAATTTTIQAQYTCA